MSNPYLITGPALISFSGGRTSAYMLKNILDAHDGVLPDDVHVCFANTGKEREETLRFVHECATNWNVRVQWIEWASRLKSVPINERFVEVGYNSASRNGEPFEALIKSKGITPNGLMRFCTEELKVAAIENFMLSLGYTTWNNVIGLRVDEMHRVFKQYDKNTDSKRRWQTIMPMVKAKARHEDVMQFWAENSFDLQLKPYEGNCDLCFLKGGKILKRIIRDNPESAIWWDKIEKTIGKGSFSKERTYAGMVNEVAASPLLPLEDGDDDEFDAECGLWCTGE